MSIRPSGEYFHMFFKTVSLTSQCHPDQNNHFFQSLTASTSGHLFLAKLPGVPGVPGVPHNEAYCPVSRNIVAERCQATGAPAVVTTITSPERLTPLGLQRPSASQHTEGQKVRKLTNSGDFLFSFWDKDVTFIPVGLWLCWTTADKWLRQTSLMICWSPHYSASVMQLRDDCRLWFSSPLHSLCPSHGSSQTFVAIYDAADQKVLPRFLILKVYGVMLREILNVWI